MSDSEREADRTLILNSLQNIAYEIKGIEQRAETLVIRYSIENLKFSFADWHRWLNVQSTLKAIQPHLDELIEGLKTPEQKNKLSVGDSQ
jgi:hypothetical protein